jgi:geranylgeranyl diphosphate synthase type II
MDNDDLRRGMPTSHKMFGEAIAVLAGDGLLNLAYETMLEACSSMGRRASAGLRAAGVIARSSGGSGMVAGQTVDVLCENKTVDKGTLLYIHSNKTSSLISACLQAGGILAECGEACLASLKEAGDKLGLAFQIQDDLLDVTETTETLGKPAKSDMKSNKATYISIYGLEKARAELARLSEEACGILDGLDWKDGFIKDLARRMRQ